MFKNKLLKMYVAAIASMTVMSNAVAQDASTGFAWAREQTETQATAFVGMMLTLAFAYGVTAIILGVINLRKMGKDQLPDDKKSVTWFLLISGAAATIIPLILAFTTGILGGGESAAEAVDLDWGL